MNKISIEFIYIFIKKINNQKKENAIDKKKVLLKIHIIISLFDIYIYILT